MNEEQITTLTDSIFEQLKCSEELTVKFIQTVLDDIKTFDDKQHDYGSQNIADFGEYGVLVRVNDKVARLKNLKDSDDPKNESIDDSWKDLSVYGIIARLCRAGDWK